MQPAEKDVATGLHQPLTGDDPLAMVSKLARTEELLEHRRIRLLELEQQRVPPVEAEQQRNPGARAYATDANHLAREIGHAELLQQHAPVVLQRAPVGAQLLV